MTDAACTRFEVSKFVLSEIQKEHQRSCIQTFATEEASNKGLNVPVPTSNQFVVVAVAFVFLRKVCSFGGPHARTGALGNSSYNGFTLHMAEQMKYRVTWFLLPYLFNQRCTCEIFIEERVEMVQFSYTTTGYCFILPQVILPGESAEDSRKRTWEEALVSWRTQVGCDKKD